jgi:hypothetical protein
MSAALVDAALQGQLAANKALPRVSSTGPGDALYSGLMPLLPSLDAQTATVLRSYLRVVEKTLERVEAAHA